MCRSEAGRCNPGATDWSQEGPNVWPRSGFQFCPFCLRYAGLSGG